MAPELQAQGDPTPRGPTLLLHPPPGAEAARPSPRGRPAILAAPHLPNLGAGMGLPLHTARGAGRGAEGGRGSGQAADTEPARKHLFLKWHEKN